MCGIVGMVHPDPSHRLDPQPVVDAMHVIEHRGPDDGGFYGAPGVVLGNRRLAILDLSARGHMPMSSPDGRYWITHNGEIYNFRDLRRGLEQQGFQFRTNTDTETLLAMYEARGAAMLDELNGMFAFAIWDTHERALFVARDRLGVKPLYYAVHEGVLYFGSEQKALFAAGVPRVFDERKWEELLCFRYVAGEDTPFRGVRRLLPGHFLTARRGLVQIRCWWDLESRAEARRETLPGQPPEWFREIFRDAVRLRRTSDVPVGVLLSGGLDSSSVAGALAADAGSGVASFTVRFPERGYDEGDFAQRVAVRWGLDSHELTLSTADLLDGVRAASWLNDEPLVHGSDLHLHAIARHARPLVTVLLSGEGADETLGGYVRYQPLRYPTLLAAMNPLLGGLPAAMRRRGRIRKLARFLSLGSLDAFVLFNACDTLPVDLERIGLRATAVYPYRQTLLEKSRAIYGSDHMRRAMFIDQHTFLCSLLDRNDRMTMGASIECRVPFLDYRLVETAAALPSSSLIAGRRTKPLLRRAMAASLPRAVRAHSKWGFGVPWGRYLREVPELRRVLTGLPDEPLFRASPLDRGKMRAVLHAFLEGDDRHEPIAKQLLMLGVWHDAYFSRPARPERRSTPVAVA